MKKITSIVLLSGFLLVLYACTSSETKKEVGADSVLYQGDNSHVSLDWEGIYEGTLPCADCPGIITILTLKGDNTFTMFLDYMERDTKMTDTGIFTWDSEGSVIHLKGKSTDVKYKVGENRLIQLDLEGNAIDGPMKDAFNLTKHSIAH